MKTTKAITLAAMFLMLSVAVIANVGHVLAAPPSGPTYNSFYLEATDGDVTLILSGSLNGKSNMVFSLNVEGGSVSVEEYETIAVMKGSGVLVKPSNYLHLSIMTDKAYGGSHAAWVLKGETTGEMVDGSVPISLDANKVVLPQSTGTVMLVDLHLEGVIDFSTVP